MRPLIDSSDSCSDRPSDSSSVSFAICVQEGAGIPKGTGLTSVQGAAPLSGDVRTDLIITDRLTRGRSVTWSRRFTTLPLLGIVPSFSFEQCTFEFERLIGRQEWMLT